MAGHGPAVKLGKDNASEWKSKLGVILFFVYAAFYVCFVTINTVKPKLMGITVVATAWFVVGEMRPLETNASLLINAF